MPAIMNCHGCGKRTSENRSGKCRDCRMQKCLALGCEEIYLPVKGIIYCRKHQEQRQQGVSNRRRNPHSSGSVW